MKGEDKVIHHLNVVLANELTAINQYFLHAKMFKNWGLEKLAAHEYKESIDEMKHADMLMERILFLEGRPTVQLKKLLVGDSTKEVLSCDLKLELTGHPASERSDCLLREDRRLRQPRPVPVHHRVGGRAYRLAGNPARTDRESRYPELPAVEYRVTCAGDCTGGPFLDGRVGNGAGPAVSVPAGDLRRGSRLIGAGPQRISREKRRTFRWQREKTSQ